MLVTHKKRFCSVFNSEGCTFGTLYTVKGLRDRVLQVKGKGLIWFFIGGTWKVDLKLWFLIGWVSNLRDFWWGPTWGMDEHGGFWKERKM